MGQFSKAARGIRPNVRAIPYTSNVGGIVQNRAERYIPISAAIDILNMHPLEEGSWDANNIGYTHVNATAYESGARINGLFRFNLNGTDSLLAACNGKLLSINVTTGAPTTADGSAGYAVNGQVDGLQLNNLLFTCDGTIPPRKWDGTTGAAAGGFPINADKTNPKFIEKHNDRAVYLNFQGATKYPSHFAISNYSDPEVFTLPPVTDDDAFLGEVGVGDGQSITGAKSIFLPQSNESVLAIFKERATYILRGDSPMPDSGSPFTILQVNANYGAVNNASIVQVGNDLLSLGELPGGGYGILSYTSSIENGTLQPKLIGSDLVKDTLAKINVNAVQACYAVHMPSRREVWFGLPLGANSAAKDFLVYKYPGAEGESPKWFRRNQFNHTTALIYQNKVFVASADGFIDEMFTAPTMAGISINWSYEFPYNGLGNERQFKKFFCGFLHLDAIGAQSINIKTTWFKGGNNNSRVQNLIIMGNGDFGRYGTGIYGQSRYGSASELKEKFYIPGNGERFKIKVSGNTTSAGGGVFQGITLVAEYGGISQHYN